MLQSVPLYLNLAALTEAELLGLYGQEALQARLPELAQARLQGRTVPDAEIPETLHQHPATREQFGATPAQTRALADLHSSLQELGATFEGTFHFPPPQGEAFSRLYTLEPDLSVAVRWYETPGKISGPTLWLLSWLRDQASGVGCVLSTSAPAPAPAYSEQISVHTFTEPLVPALAKHRQQVQRMGRPQKLSGIGGWQAAWQAAHELNLSAWRRRGVLL